MQQHPTGHVHGNHSPLATAQPGGNVRGAAYPNSNRAASHVQQAKPISCGPAILVKACACPVVAREFGPSPVRIQGYRSQRGQVAAWALAPPQFSGANLAVTAVLDLNGIVPPEELLDLICSKAEINKKEIVLTWASPPCKTFSSTNWPNPS